MSNRNGHSHMNGGMNRSGARADTEINHAQVRGGRIGLISGSGTYALPLEDSECLVVETEFGAAEMTLGRLGELEVAHISRHGDGHPRLSNHVTHRANIAALALLGARCAVGMTICGAIDPELRLGDMIVFDDLYFPTNRLPDGSLCTFHVAPGDPRRAHWIFERPYSAPLRRALADAAGAVLGRVRDGGCYGHVDGPRFNTAAEIGALRMCGVTAVSQTAGPETVLAGEAGIPFALLGYVTDYANGAGPKATAVDELIGNMVSSVDAFGRVLRAALPGIPAASLDSIGERYGFETRLEVYNSAR